MDTKYQSLLFCLLLLAFQEMIIMRVEAAMCQSNSRVFRGACFSSRNCGSICEKEGFENGQCRFFKCVCSKDCNTSGGGGGGGGGGGSGGGDEPPPEEGPPGEGPPEDGPPADGPPEEGPSAHGQKSHPVNRKSLIN